MQPTTRSTNPPTNPPPILSIGDLVADFIVSIPVLPVEANRHQVARDIRLEPGGGANFLIAGARLGYPMMAIGALGDDIWGHQVAALIEAEGVQLAGVRYAGTTTQVIVLVSQTSEHVFLGKYGHGSKIELGQVEVDLIKSAGAIYCAGYTLCEARLVELSLEAMRLAQQFNIPVFFDPGPQMAEASIELRQTVLPLVDTLLITEEEISLITPGSMTGLIQAGLRMAVVKRGAGGCTVYQSPSSSFEVAGYPVPVVDTSAAGDSFNAAFMVARLWGWPVADCARLANVVGAAKVKKLGGGRNVPTLAEIREIITEFDVDLKLDIT